MATPLDLRNRRRDAQRVVRLAVNAINANLDAWKAAVGDGKRHATALTNAVLTQLHLPALPLGPLADVPNLRDAAESKLQEQQAAALESLAACLERLQQAAAELAAAAASLQALIDQEAEAPLLMERPVFASLSLPAVQGAVQEVVGMHQAELQVKAGVLAGFQEIVGDLRAADQPGANSSGSRSSGAGGTGSAAARHEEQLRRTMQVYVSAWMLCVEVDEGRVEGQLAAVTNDMRGF